MMDSKDCSILFAVRRPNIMAQTIHNDT